VAPGAVTVIVPTRWLVVVLAATIILKEPLFEPLAGVNVSQDALLDTFQVLLEVTFTDKELPALGALHEEWDSVKLAGGAAAAWVTDTVRVDAPGADTVMVPERWLVVLLAAANILKGPLLEALVGVTVSQDTLLLTFQVLLEVTFTDMKLPPLGALHEEWDRFKVAAAGRVLNVIGGLCSVPVVPDTLTIARA